MSAWGDLRDVLRDAILTQDRVEQLTTSVDRLTEGLQDHDRRLVRIETMIELAQRNQLPDGST